MQTEFDQIVDRVDTGSSKWELYRGRDIIPMWVADMDFRSPEPVLRALHDRVAHGVFGYSPPPRRLAEIVAGRCAALYDWEVEPEWIVMLPGVIAGLHLACRAVGASGDQVITTLPAYYPFLEAPGNSERELVTAPLSHEGGRWSFDYEAFEAALTDRTRLFILCNPYNPVGRVLTREELERICGICLRRGIVICSDEIHCDLILEERLRHIPTATLDAEIARNSITLVAPSKTFNLPGLNCALAIIPDARLRSAYNAFAHGLMPHVNVLGLAAAEAAYRDCEVWRQHLLGYLRANRDYIETEISAMPGLSMDHVEATYLAWIDATATGVANPRAFFEQAGVGLSDGARFGLPGFVRLNFGTRRDLVALAMARMRAALADFGA